jgi:hypothetical protein
VGAAIGDEWLNSATNLLYKRTVINGAVVWANIGIMPTTGTTSTQILTLTSTGTVALLNPSSILDYNTPSAQYALSGGGTVVWNGSRIKWSARVIAIPLKNPELAIQGYADIVCPTSGTILYYASGNTLSTVTCDANGIPLADWQSLWYQIGPSQSSSPDSSRFRVVDYTSTGWAPGFGWVLIAARNSDATDGHVKWLPGQINFPAASGTYYSGTGLMSWATGATGVTGFTGSQGIQGVTGFVGSQGIQGATGFVGSRGFDGSRGFTGFDGSRGFTGSIGFTGSQGIQGITGFTGSQGIQGITGFVGSQGIQGITGFVGSQGLPGGGGATGFVGSRGFTGFDGSRGFTGSIGFTGSQGLPGGGGATGFTGSQGIQGITGFVGSQGIQGITGFVGSQGIQGITGFIGSRGFDGSRGYDGSRGATGFDGSRGFTGSIGFTGSQGIQGVTGFVGSSAANTPATPTSLGSVFGYTTANGNSSLGCCSGNTTQTGSNNVAIGCNSLFSNTTGSNNTAIGCGALSCNTTGYGNAAIGYGALRCNTVGGGNIAIGSGSLCNNSIGRNNIAMGVAALQSSTTGNENTAIGKFALRNNSTGCNNVAIGHEALYGNASGINNIAIGCNTLRENTGNNNAAFGTLALRCNTIGNDNIAAGVRALYFNTTGSNNIAIGQCAGCNITTGANNTVIGVLPAAAGCVCTVLIGAGTCERIRVDNSGLYVNNTLVNTSGASAATPTSLGTVFGYTITNGNTSLGCCAGNTTQTGFSNIAIGCQALVSNATGCNNLAQGYNALRRNSIGCDNTAIGRDALCCNTTGNNNVSIGFQALSRNTTGSNNIGIGCLALVINTAGRNNTAMGSSALRCNTLGNNNFAAGESALLCNTTGCNNTAIGFCALLCNSGGCNNVAFGCIALINNTYGNNNFAVGEGALCCNSIGCDNVAQGYKALGKNTTGSNNIGIGRIAGCNITTGANNTVIGSLPAAAGCVCTLLLGAGTCERIRVDNSGLYVNNTLVNTSGSTSYIRKTTTYTAVNGDKIIADTSGGAFTITLPASPATGDNVTFVDGGDWAVNNLTVGRNSQTIEGSATDLILDVGSLITVTLVFDGTTWEVYANSSPSISVTDDTVSNVTQYLGMTQNTSGALSTAYIASSKLYFNPSTGILNSIDFNSLSDARLKDNIQSLSNSINLLKNVNPVSFVWKDSGRKSFGVIAQELEKILPDLVETNADSGMKSVSYVQLIALLIDAVTAQQEEINMIKNRLGIDK